MSPSVARSGFARLTIVTVTLSLALVALGGAVRATDSGLACPTWPGCFSAGDFLPPADVHVWLEHSHRLVAGLLGALGVTQLIWALRLHRSRPGLVAATAVAAVAFLGQALLGAAVVWGLLRAELVTFHLGLGMAVVGCLVGIAVAANRERPDVAPARSLAWTSAAVAGLTLLQILVGGQVTGIGAGLAFVGRAPFLGLVAFGPLDGPPEAYNLVHRMLAGLLVVAVGALARQARLAGVSGWVARLPHLIGALLVVQILLGVANLWNGLSFLSVIPHLAVASWMWAALVLETALAFGVGHPAAADRVIRLDAPALAGSRG